MSETNTYADHPAVVALAAKLRRPPAEGHITCPTCEGLGLRYMDEPGTVVGCGTCYAAGQVRVCKHCGEALTGETTAIHHCPPLQALVSREYAKGQLAQWRKHPALAWEQATETVYSARLEKSLQQGEDDLDEDWFHHLGISADDELPPIDPEWALLYCTKPVAVAFDAESLLGGIYDEYSTDEWDPTEDVGTEARQDLQQVLDAWTDRHKLREVGWEPDHSRPLLPPAVGER